MHKKKFIIVATIPAFLQFFDGQYELLKAHYDITAISSERDKLEAFGKARGLATHYVRIEREIALLTDLRALFSLIAYFRKERPYMVHGNTPKGSLLSMLAAWITRVPVRIYMCHGLRYQGCSGFERRLLMTMERIACWYATHVVSVSKGVRDVLLQDKITRKQPILIGNGSVCGIDSRKFDPDATYPKEELRARYGLKADHFVLTYVGRIVKDKGINELVEAFDGLSRKYPSMRLLLIGQTEQVNLISELTLQRINDNPAIIVTGHQEDIPAFLSITDLFMFPSYREGFGVAVMEAGAMGVPAVTTDITGCNEVVENGKTGLLIAPRSVQAIVEAVEKLYNDPQLLAALKARCRKSIVDRYEEHRLWKQYADFYTSL